MTETMMIIIVAGVVIMAFGILCLISIFRAQKETQGFAKRMGAVEKDLSDITQMVSKNAADSQKADEDILSYLQRQEEKLAEQEAALRAKQFEQPQETTVPEIEEMVIEEPEPLVQQPEPLVEEMPAPAPQPQPTPQPAPAPVAEAAPPVVETPPVKVPEPAVVTPAPAPQPEKEYNFDEIDINDLLDDLEDVLPELARENIPQELTKEDVLPELTKRAEPAVIEEPEIVQPQIQHIDYDIGQSGRRYTASELETLIRE